MATIKEKKKKDGSVSYEIRVSLGRDINGKQIFKYLTWQPETKMSAKQLDKELQRQAILFEEKCRQGKVLDTSTKFAEFAEEWLKANEDKHSPAYQSTAKRLLTRINAGIGHISINKLQPHHLQAFYNNLAEDGIKKTNTHAVSNNLQDIMKKKKITRTALESLSGVSETTIASACQGKNVKLVTAQKISDSLNMKVTDLFTILNKKESLSPKTISHYHRLISSILETAVKWQVIYDNPARRVEPPKVPRKEATYLDDNEIMQVIAALETEPLKWQTILMLLIYSGMRRGELCGLSWEDVDFDYNIVHITKTSQYLSGKGVFDKDTKTTNSDRVIKLPDEMFHLLRQYRAWQTEERLAMGDRWQNSGKIFTQSNGLPIHPDSITGWIKKFTERNNLPKFSPHSLRHTNATLLIMSGIPVKTVSARLGHADQNVTNAIYAHSIQTADAIASDVIGEILNKKSENNKGA